MAGLYLDQTSIMNDLIAFVEKKVLTFSLFRRIIKFFILSPWNIQLMSMASTAILFTSILWWRSLITKSHYSWHLSSFWEWWSFASYCSRLNYLLSIRFAFINSFDNTFLWLTKEVLDAKTNSSNPSGHGIVTSYYINRGRQIQSSKKFLIRLDCDSTMYGMTLIMVFEKLMVLNSYNISTISSNDLVLYFLRAKSRAVWPSLSGISKQRGDKYSFSFRDFSSFLV